MKNQKGLILIYPGFQNEAKLYQYNRMIEEFNKLGMAIEKLKVDEIITMVEKGNSNLHIEQYDFCIQLVKDKYINALLEKSNIRSFNTYTAIENCDDKMMAYTLLAGNHIKMPTTICGNRNTGVEKIEDTTLNDKFKNYIEEKLGYPLIAKKSDSKGGRDIYKIENRIELNEICEKLKGSQYLFQKYVSENIGKDIRVPVVGGKVIGAFLRENANDFRSNISTGGKAVPYSITEEHKRIAEKVAQILKLDYCSVDFFLTDNKEPLLCEVNADPALRSMEKILNQNVAEIFAKYVIDEIKNK